MLGLQNAWDSLTTGGKVLACIVSILAVFGVVFIVRLITVNHYVPLDSHIMQQRAATNALQVAHTKKMSGVSLPNEDMVLKNQPVDIPMLSQILINNKLRGDDLQKELDKYYTKTSILAQSGLKPLVI